MKFIYMNFMEYYEIRKENEVDELVLLWKDFKIY